MQKKICLIASSGGHFEQLLMLKSLEHDFDIYFVTERTPYSKDESGVYYIKQVNREERFIIVNMIIVSYQSLKIFLKEKPDLIISTGALSVIPTFFIGKVFKRQTIFIESFAKVSSPTLTGQLLYKIADYFIVQWEEMLKVYPKALFLGSIY